MKKKTVRQQKEKERGSAGSNFGSAAIKGNHLKLPALCEASLTETVRFKLGQFTEL